MLFGTEKFMPNYVRICVCATQFDIRIKSFNHLRWLGGGVVVGFVELMSLQCVFGWADFAMPNEQRHVVELELQAEAIASCVTGQRPAHHIGFQ